MSGDFDLQLKDWFERAEAFSFFAVSEPAPGPRLAFASHYGRQETGDISVSAPLETGMVDADASPLAAPSAGVCGLPATGYVEFRKNRPLALVVEGDDR
ncbi:hypothetical protein [Streptomyces sp. NPDC058145]|uniref:hypothetical protein n=1 Tax=Streptomyces sp. NPDC058145 TaxID=3346356 RepID=UPI0036E1A3FA